MKQTKGIPMFRTVLVTTLIMTATTATADFVKLSDVTIHSDRTAIHAAAVQHFNCARPSYNIHYGTIAADPNALLANQTAVLEGTRAPEVSDTVLKDLMADTDNSVWVALDARRSGEDCS